MLDDRLRLVFSAALSAQSGSGEEMGGFIGHPAACAAFWLREEAIAGCCLNDYIFKVPLSVLFKLVGPHSLFDNG
jgi:hypothetical protein